MIENLNQAETTALLDLASIADSLRIPLMLIGANARRLAFDIPFGFESPRTTQDWDFAAPMQNWDAFARFYQRAIQEPPASFRPGDSIHRIIHQSTGILIDLVPFGPLKNAQGQIHWPQTRQVMSVLGFEEAFESCLREMLPNGIEIRIVTPALLAALKIIAFSERGEQFSRDLHDLWFIMERYARPAPHEHRVFNELVEHFPDDPACYDHLDSLLLGWDIGRQCQPATLAAMTPLLRELASPETLRIEPLLPKTGDLEEQGTKQRKITSEFQWLQRGIAMATKAKTPP